MNFYRKVFIKQLLIWENLGVLQQDKVSATISWAHYQRNYLSLSVIFFQIERKIQILV